MLNYGEISLTLNPEIFLFGIGQYYVHFAHSTSLLSKIVEVTMFYFEFIEFSNTF